MADTIYIHTDQVGTFGVLRDQNGDPITDARVTITIIDKNNVELVDQPYPFPMTFVHDTEGNYTIDLPNDHGLVDEKNYLCKYVAVKSNVKAEWHGVLQATYASI